VQLKATIANALWSVSNVPSYLRFRRALREPQVVQWYKLRTYLERNAHTEFGKAHNFDSIHNHEEFTSRVPLADYETIEPWITRIRHGETNVLTYEPVTHLVPTSGSTGARKLIPFTVGLQREFDAAIGPWLVDLQRQSPGIINGPAYWSVTPSLKDSPVEESAVPIGFDADTAYLGGTRRRLGEMVLAVPSNVQCAESLETFRYETLLYLLRCRELRLISVWHPSFVTLLLDALPANWEKLLDEIASGRKDSLRPLPQRANELRGIGWHNPAALWPELRLISCWGDGNAEIAIAELQARFPDVSIQRKGLLATEAVVTIPFSGRELLAVRSHFFEFIDGDGRIRLVHELQQGEEYEVVVTTSGGLWRYRLQDRIRVLGFSNKTPALRFLGRTGSVSDLFGEKLSEAFANEVLRKLTANSAALPRFILLAPEREKSGGRYVLYVEGDVSDEIVLSLDGLLLANPHYAWCRKLGQLQTPYLFRIRKGGYESFVARETKCGSRIGDIKPRVFSPETGWLQHFNGR
jgi:hypothetical protein